MFKMKFGKRLMCLALGAVLVAAVHPAYAATALKKLVAVESFENKAGAASSWEIGDGMADMLTDALIQSGNFIVLERQALESVLQEQDFAASGRTTTAGATASIGKMPPAQILIRGAITEFDESKKGGGQGLNIRGFNVNMNRDTAHVAVIIRLIDTSTGEVLDSQRVEGNAEAGGLGFDFSGSGFGFGQEGFSKTPLGKATQIAIDNAVDYVTQKMRAIPWEGKVVTVQGETIIINSGTNTGIQVGDQFTVFHKGEDFIDPDTGMLLGSDTSQIGVIEVVNVQEKFSKAVAVSGSGFQAKDIVRGQ